MSFDQVCNIKKEHSVEVTFFPPAGKVTWKWQKDDCGSPDCRDSGTHNENKNASIKS